jgi:uncharacterized protein YgiB involved in biofilm formation
MNRMPSKKFIFAAILAVAALVGFVATRRSPACSGEGKIMSTQTECLNWGFDAATCKSAVEKARDAAVRATPRLDNSIQCETQFTDCFEAPQGGFHPKPSFCLRASAKEAAEPLEMRYLQYESDRMNRKKTREIPFN